MMDALKCDRCGSLYEKPVVPLLPLEKAWRFQDPIGEDTVLTIRVFAEMLPRMKDICPPCIHGCLAEILDDLAVGPVIAT